MKPLILTYTGKHVNPLDLRAEDIDIRDIAHALALCNRFAGHSRKPLSVAQHSVYVARLCDYSYTFQRQALLHDASEAYLGDVTKWLKNTPEFERYRKAEERVQAQIFSRFGITTAMYDAVGAMDKVMLRFEGQQAFGTTHWEEWSNTLPNYPMITKSEIEKIGKWSYWTWQESERQFLAAARSLFIEIPGETDVEWSRRESGEGPEG